MNLFLHRKMLRAPWNMSSLCISSGRDDFLRQRLLYRYTLSCATRVSFAQHGLQYLGVWRRFASRATGTVRGSISNIGCLTKQRHQTCLGVRVSLVIQTNATYRLCLLSDGQNTIVTFCSPILRLSNSISTAPSISAFLHPTRSSNPKPLSMPINTYSHSSPRTQQNSSV